MKKVMGILLAALTVIALISCAKNELMGVWDSNPELDMQNAAPEAVALLGVQDGNKECNFNEDGTFSTTIDGAEVQSGTYAIDGSTLYIYDKNYDHTSGETDTTLKVEGTEIKDSRGNVVAERPTAQGSTNT